MDVKTGHLLWNCGLRPVRHEMNRTEWAVVTPAPTYADEAMRQIKPSRMAIRNAAKQLTRVRGTAVMQGIMRRFGMRNTIDDIKVERWPALYFALLAATEVEPST